MYNVSNRERNRKCQYVTQVLVHLIKWYTKLWYCIEKRKKPKDTHTHTSTMINWYTKLWYSVSDRQTEAERCTFTQTHWINWYTVTRPRYTVSERKKWKNTCIPKHTFVSQFHLHLHNMMTNNTNVTNWLEQTPQVEMVGMHVLYINTLLCVHSDESRWTWWSGLAPVAWTPTEGYLSTKWKLAAIWEVKTRSVYLELTNCPFLLLFAGVYKDLNNVQVTFNESLYQFFLIFIFYKLYEC